MLIKINNDKLIEININDFITDREYYIYIMSLKNNN